MNIYRVSGIRHETVVFAASPAEAVAQAQERGEVGDWEIPEAREIPLPKGYGLQPARLSLEWLALAMEEAWTTLRQRVESLTDPEFFWEPVPGCWTVHPTEKGQWICDYADPAPEPPPFTTIAWRVVHIATCKIMYHEYAFGPGKLTWDELDIPPTAARAIAWLEEGQARLEAALAALNDADLTQMRSTNWGELWPTWRIFWTMTCHDLHHGAEIGCLRDLYRIMQHREK
jgi:hypothetical protein